MPAVAVWAEPPAMPASGRSEVPDLNSTWSRSSPSPSAAIWASAVQAPWPMSWAPISITPEPSLRSTARASAWNISAGKVAVPMPQPTSRPASSRICRGASGRFDQPKRSAPCA